MKKTNDIANEVAQTWLDNVVDRGQFDELLNKYNFTNGQWENHPAIIKRYIYSMESARDISTNEISDLIEASKKALITLEAATNYFFAFTPTTISQLKAAIEKINNYQSLRESNAALMNYKDYVEARIGMDEMPLTFEQWQYVEEIREQSKKH
jgi:hypothetical protein